MNEWPWLSLVLFTLFALEYTNLPLMKVPQPKKLFYGVVIGGEHIVIEVVGKLWCAFILVQWSEWFRVQFLKRVHFVFKLNSSVENFDAGLVGGTLD